MRTKDGLEVGGEAAALPAAMAATGGSSATRLDLDFAKVLKNAG
jgi:hypothetical protein